jgi:hypothetical protein
MASINSSSTYSESINRREPSARVIATAALREKEEERDLIEQYLIKKGCDPATAHDFATTKKNPLSGRPIIATRPSGLTHSHLLSLPEELQVWIYNYVTYDPLSVIMKQDSYEESTGKSLEIFSPPGLCQVNREIRRRTLQEFYENTVFHISPRGMGNTARGQLSESCAWLDAIGPMNRSHLKRLKLTQITRFYTSFSDSDELEDGDSTDSESAETRPEGPWSEDVEIEETEEESGSEGEALEDAEFDCAESEVSGDVDGEAYRDVEVAWNLELLGWCLQRITSFHGEMYSNSRALIENRVLDGVGPNGKLADFISRNQDLPFDSDMLLELIRSMCRDYQYEPDIIFVDREYR